MTRKIMPCLALLLLAGCSAADAAELEVNGKRLNQTMSELQQFGPAASGGSDRVAYSAANRDALRWLSKLLQSAGMMTHIDAAGNLVGRIDGKKPLPPLVTGSHIDTVPNGGHYDGIVGVMAAIEVAQTLNDAGRVLDHPLEVIVWSNEEGGKTGSRSMNGSVADRELDLPSLGQRSLGDGMQFLGGKPSELARIERHPGDIAAYVELHIEQGAELDRQAINIGVVEGIVGIKRWNVTVDGKANHAGTTPMDQRRDAMYAAARFITAVREEITSVDGSQVATVGRIRAEPGAPNVIPGKAVLSLEIRDLSMQKIDQLFAAIGTRAREIGKATGTDIQFSQFYESPAALTNPAINQQIAAAADTLGLSHQMMPSGAGHDAQSIAPLAPIGMIFVPSRDGISHAPDEFTSATDITNGANVLLLTLLSLDRQQELN